MSEQAIPNIYLTRLIGTLVMRRDNERRRRRRKERRITEGER